MVCFFYKLTGSSAWKTARQQAVRIRERKGLFTLQEAALCVLESVGVAGGGGGEHAEDRTLRLISRPDQDWWTTGYTVTQCRPATMFRRIVRGAHLV